MGSRRSAPEASIQGPRPWARWRMAIGVCLLVGGAGCGYSVGRGASGPRTLAVSMTKEPGIDLDAAAMVDNATRRALTRSPSTRLVSQEGADQVLEVELLQVQAGLAPFAEPGLRAAQYQVSVRIKGRVVDSSGRALWSSATITGEAPFVSTPGSLEALDGARRRALARASDEAADRLVAALALASWQAPR